MKHYASVFARRYIVSINFLFLIVVCLILPLSSAGGDEVYVGDELISLTAKNEPLGDVLYKVSVATGYDISLDNKWQNYRVTASLEKVSLHKGLKRILRNLNSAIIYVSSKKIKIIIYDKKPSEETSSIPTAERSFDREQGFQQRPPTSQTIENEDNPVSDEEPLGSPPASDGEEVDGDRSVSDKEPSDPPVFSNTQKTNKDLEDESLEESSENGDQVESKNE